VTEPMTAPVEARCDHCKQLRPLFRYEALHAGHFTPAMVTCRWCNRDEEPLLCVRCWSKERELEEADPGVAAERAVLEQICANNRRAIARSEQDRATCDAIAKATEEAS
jgi:hypothetical protein